MSGNTIIGTKRSAVSLGEYGPCKFFASGSCKFGVSCMFHHVAATVSSKISVPCQFFSKGKCADGDQCRFLHIHRPDSGELPVKSASTVCKYHISLSGCRMGDSCAYSHPSNTMNLDSIPRKNEGAAAKILQKYSSSKTAEQQGSEADCKVNHKL